MNNYRAWHEESKEYVYFDYKKMAKDQFQSQIFMELASQDKLEISTGLFDKNGKELFENDFIEHIGCRGIPDGVSKIIWNNGASAFFIENDKLDIYDYFENVSYSCKYVGHVHEGEK